MGRGCKLIIKFVCKLEDVRDLPRPSVSSNGLENHRPTLFSVADPDQCDGFGSATCNDFKYR